LVSLLVAACAVAALGGSTGGAVPIASAQPVSGAQRISHDQVLTYNWAGYAVYQDATQFSDVQGSWVQPAAQNCPARKTQLAAFFVGIDGANSTSVEQVGTETNCVNGSATYTAWYEMYPDPPVYFDNCPLTDGDNVYAEVAYVSGSQFHVTLTINSSTCIDLTVTAPGTPARSSAEWITEAPATGRRFWPLTDFGSITYTGASAAAGATTGNITSPWLYDEFTMVDHGNPFAPPVKAQPTLLTGSSFRVDWVSTG
jgi:hypothetical protein